MRELERETTSPPPTAAGLEDEVAELRLLVIGAGRAGGSIAAAARRAGLDVELAGRDERLAGASSERTVLLCVPDGALEEVAEAIGSQQPPPRLVGHVSGSVGLSVLAPVTECGALGFTLHPLQTLPDRSSDLTGAACAVSGSTQEASAYAEALARRLGMTPFALADEQRAAYHAAASMASNFLVALEESASELLQAAGIDEGRETLAPLVLRTAANWSEHGSAALTGPIARGDEATVQRHLEAIERHAPQLVPLYRELAARTREIAAGGAASSGGPR